MDVPTMMKWFLLFPLFLFVVTMVIGGAVSLAFYFYSECKKELEH